MAKIVVESRPLIGTAQVFISLSNAILQGECYPVVDPIKNVIGVCEKGNNDDEKIRFAFRWPKCHGQISLLGTDWCFSLEHKSLTFRLRVDTSKDDNR